MMTATEASEKLIDLILANEDIANRAEGCDAGQIAVAERDIGMTFPPSYRRLIEEFGTWDIAGEDFLGAYQTPAMGQKILGSVAETLGARNQYGLPLDLIVAMFDGMGGLIVLDASQPDQEHEYPVLVWNPESADRESMEKLGDNFGSFALRLCRRAVATWRESE